MAIFQEAADTVLQLFGTGQHCVGILRLWMLAQAHVEATTMLLTCSVPAFARECSGMHDACDIRQQSFSAQAITLTWMVRSG